MSNQRRASRGQVDPAFDLPWDALNEQRGEKPLPAPPSTASLSRKNNHLESTTEVHSNISGIGAYPPASVTSGHGGPRARSEATPEPSADRSRPASATSLENMQASYSVRYPRTGKPVKDKNYIKTTKYTFLTFVPLNLIGQFRRIYNLYFLVGALTTLGGDATLSKTSAIMPLLVVVLITMIKDGLEDYRRYQADSQANATKYTVVVGDKLEQVASRNIAPGDICMVLKGEKFPSDLVLLSSSIDDGTCFIETSDLDGETNLKRRMAVGPLAPLQDLEEIVQLKGVIRCPLPNEKLNEFDGTIRIEDSVDIVGLQILAGTRDTDDQSPQVMKPTHQTGAVRQRQMYPLSVSQFLPRGALLRNTDYVFGVVVYAGLDTKIMRNLRATSLKFSTLQGKLNWLVFGVFIYNMFLLAYSVAAQIITQRSYSIPYQATGDAFSGPWYLWDPTNPKADNFLTQTNWWSAAGSSILTWFAIYTYVIPISLFVSIELTRVFQGMFMTADLRMRGTRKGEHSRTSTQLGVKGGDTLRSRRQSAASLGRPGSVGHPHTTSPVPNQSQVVQSRPRTGDHANGVLEPNRTDVEGRLGSSSMRGMNISGSVLATTKRNRSALQMTMKLREGKLGPELSEELVPMKANNTNLNEDLGCVEYVFSDKTGTLTQNEMRISKWWVGGETIEELLAPQSLMKRVLEPGQPTKTREDLFSYVRALILAHEVIPSVDDSTGELVYESQSPDETAILEGLKANNVELVGRTKNSLSVSFFDPNEDQHYELLVLLEFNSDRKRMSVVVRHPPPRSSVAGTKGPIFLYCKGADNIILPRLSTDPSVNDPSYVRSAERALEAFSVEGLRTLVVASKLISEDEWSRLSAAHEAAAVAIQDRERKVNAVFDGVESGLKLLGLTAIEDRLQDQVPQTIDYMLKANIRVWVLTGDKQETAINIGMSAQLLNPSMNLYIVNSRSEADITKQIQLAIQQLKERDEWGNDHVVSAPTGYERIFGKSRPPFSQGSGFGDPPELENKWRRNGLVVTGDVLNILFASWSKKDASPGAKPRRKKTTVRSANDRIGDIGNPQPSRASIGSTYSQVELSSSSKVSTWIQKNLKFSGDNAGLTGELTDLQRQFLELATRCNSKAQVVTLVRAHLKKVTLAIGDGANDVTMIQAADIGVGIIGREGAQAVRASDYAFLEFKFLRRLISVHGRYDYMRMCKIIFVSFYKNLAMITLLWIFGFLSMWTGLAPYEDLFLLAYNIVYVSLPPLILAIFEKDIDEEKIEQYPEAYREVQGNIYWDLKTFLIFIAESLWVSAAIFLATWATVGDSTITSTGRDIGFYNLIWFYTTTVFIAVIIKFGIVTRHWTIFHLLGIILSVAMFVIGVYLSVLLEYSESWSAGDIANVPTYYFFILLVPIAVQLPDLLGMALRDAINPPDYVILREEEYQERLQEGGNRDEHRPFGSPLDADHSHRT
ncbi:hypothetical protein HDU93_009874 [Gonapodya sp. JEL0774]|nr:hypothetical protein HDU93_009874 [Gonapodya sp. JEL0774]